MTKTGEPGGNPSEESEPGENQQQTQGSSDTLKEKGAK